MKARTTLVSLGMLGLLLAGCGGDPQTAGETHGAQTTEDAIGPNGGRVLTSGDFSLELAIVEHTAPPRFQAWATKAGQPLAPADVSLDIQLRRLTGTTDEIRFSPHGDSLRSESVIHEPHSFALAIQAVFDGQPHSWQYPSFEGRTRIDAAVARALGVETEIAGPALLKETASVYGRVRADPGRVREIRARFDGVIRGVYAELGNRVEKDETLLRVESNESLNAYSVVAPIAGIITQRDANAGEPTSGRLLLTITDTSSVWADLSVFPNDRARVQIGSPVSISPATGGAPVASVISTLEVLARADQSVVARAVLDNPDGQWLPGTFVTAEITVGEYRVPVAVKRTALQTSRGRSVVYRQVGEEYEAQELELGKEAGDHVEVLSGLEPGARYVTGNSFLIKADIEKSGASHDH